VIRRWGLGAASALFWCCAERPPLPSHGVKTPLGIEAGAPSASPSATGRGGARQIGLDEFTPLVADPRLAAVGEALGTDNPRGAARSLEQALGRATLAPAETPRWQYLLGRLREKAGESEGAAASYGLAAAETWALAEYARLGAARALVRAGRLDAAKAELGRLPESPPWLDEARELAAEIALRQHDLDRAIETLEAALAALGSGRDRASVSFRLAEALLERTGTGKRSPADADRDREQALGLARTVRFDRAGEPMALRAEALEKRVLASMPERERQRLGTLTLGQELARLRGLVGARLDQTAEQAAEALMARLSPTDRWGEIGCEAALLGAKALGQKRKAAKALAALTEPIAHCRGDDWRARALYLAGTYAAQDGRHLEAAHLFEQLERELPSQSLADDARYKAALSYYELGVEAEFTRLLSRLPDDYPRGDMVLEGTFRLALRRIERGDWAGAATVLGRGAALAAGGEYSRGTEFSGRERYFLARTLIETGEPKRGYDELERLVVELPFSYYMLHAYTRLRVADPGRAERALAEARRRAEQDPFVIASVPEFNQPGFLRAKELLSVGEIELGQREIESLGLADAGAAPQILWGVVLLYARAGAAKLSHTLARGLLTDWLRHWPAGDWVRAWQLGFPRPFAPLVTREARRNGLAEALVYAIMREESAFDADAVSPADAYGLMQLVVPTAKLHARPLGLPYDPRSLKNPAVNVALGCRTLGKLSETFAANPLLAIPGYNAGPGRPQRWLRDRPTQDFDVWVELIPFLETRRYTRRVLASRAAYAYLYDTPGSAEALLLPIKVDGQ
jgi:soluble lytic murein transglycosylase